MVFFLPIGWLYTTDPTLYRNLKNPLIHQRQKPLRWFGSGVYQGPESLTIRLLDGNICRRKAVRNEISGGTLVEFSWHILGDRLIPGQLLWVDRGLLHVGPTKVEPLARELNVAMFLWVCFWKMLLVHVKGLDKGSLCCPLLENIFVRFKVRPKLVFKAYLA